jgi:hypothetical protein
MVTAIAAISIAATIMGHSTVRDFG